MFKNLFLTSFLFLNVVAIIYPSKRENTQLLDYCYSLEKKLLRNTFQQKKNVPLKVKLISKDFAKFGVSKTQGALMNKIINQYKISKNSRIIKIVPNKLYCYAGYWIENVSPGTLESIFYAKSKKSIIQFKDLKDEINGMINNINSEYKVIKNNFNSLF